jgi:hypothetical protein
VSFGDLYAIDAHLPSRLRARLRGNCLETPGFGLPLRPRQPLAQGQESSRAGRAARSGGGLERHALHGREPKYIEMSDRSRRFPPPWSVEEHHQACFTVRDKSGQSLVRGASMQTTRWPM